MHFFGLVDAHAMSVLFSVPVGDGMSAVWTCRRRIQGMLMLADCATRGMSWMALMQQELLRS